MSKNIDISRGKALWKFNNSLCHKPNFVTELSAEQITDKIKYEIGKFSIPFSKENAKKHMLKL